MSQEIIIMSKRELNRLKVIHEVLAKRIKQKDAASILSLTERQIRNIVSAVKAGGDTGVIHRSRGRTSNRKYSDEFRGAVITAVREKYNDFGPTLASEKLESLDNLRVSRETLRSWMIQEGIWVSFKKRSRDDKHSWRKRKAHFGEMVQTDGSIGKWFEDRGPKAVIMGYVDDATGIPFARFYPAEDTRAAMDSFRKYIDTYGIPRSLYFDRNSIYKTTRQPDQDEELKGKSPNTQFSKVLEILDVEPIFAYTPQAKGRIERIFNTFNDRLIKEMRLEGVSSIEEGNKFLEEYLPKYAQRFAVEPKESENFHREVSSDMDLDWVFAFREKRTVNKDFTIRWRNRFFVLERQAVAIKNKKVTVLENLFGEIRIQFGKKYIEFKEITEDTLFAKRKERKDKQLSVNSMHRKPWKPADNHPWKRLNRSLSKKIDK